MWISETLGKGWLSATPDLEIWDDINACFGNPENQRLKMVVELKSPYRKCNGCIPIDHWVQMQVQMLVCNIDWQHSYYYSYTKSNPYVQNDYHLWGSVKREHWWMEKAFVRIEKFKQLLDKYLETTPIFVGSDAEAIWTHYVERDDYWKDDPMGNFTFGGAEKMQKIVENSWHGASKTSGIPYSKLPKSRME